MEENYEQLKKELLSYGFNFSTAELSNAVKKYPHGIPSKAMVGDDSMIFFWYPLRSEDGIHSLDSVRVYLEKKLDIPDVSVAGISAAQLDERMAKIDWNAKLADHAKDIDSDVYKILWDLVRLEEEGGYQGKELRDKLAYKHLAFTNSQRALHDLHGLVEKFGKILDIDSADKYQVNVRAIYNLLHGRFVHPEVLTAQNIQNGWLKVNMASPALAGALKIESADVSKDFTMEKAIEKAGINAIPASGGIKEVLFELLRRGNPVTFPYESNGMTAVRAFYVDPEAGMLKIDGEESAKRGLYDRIPEIRSRITSNWPGSGGQSFSNNKSTEEAQPKRTPPGR